MSRPVIRSNRRGQRRGRIRPVVIGLTCLLASALSLSTPAGAGPSDDGLKGAVDRILADKKLDGAASSIVISDAESGRVLYDRNPGNRLMPASNTKLLTSAASMDVLGPGYRYRTDVLADGDRSGGRLDGDLYLRGTGDPTCSPRTTTRWRPTSPPPGSRR